MDRNFKELFSLLMDRCNHNNYRYKGKAKCLIDDYNGGHEEFYY